MQNGLLRIFLRIWLRYGRIMPYLVGVSPKWFSTLKKIFGRFWAKLSILEHCIFWNNNYGYSRHFLALFRSFHLWSNKWHFKEHKSKLIAWTYPKLHNEILSYVDCWKFTHNAMLQRIDLVRFCITFLLQRAKTLKLCTGPHIKSIFIHQKMI